MRTERMMDFDRQEAGRYFMDSNVPAVPHPDIIDVAALRAKCEFIASAHADYRDQMRQALLAAFKKANAEGRERARDMLFADGSGLKCAGR